MTAFVYKFLSFNCDQIPCLQMKADKLQLQRHKEHSGKLYS